MPINRIQPDDKLIILTAHTALQSRGDAEYKFVQEANFLYLADINESDWLLVIEGRKQRSYLIQPSISEVQRLFDGALDGQTAKQLSGVDEVLTAQEGRVLLKKLTAEYSTVHTLGLTTYYQKSHGANPAQKRLNAKLKKLFENVDDYRPQLAKIRAIKQDDELEFIQRAVDVSADGFTGLKEALRKGVNYEYELEAILNSEFRRTGAGGHAYDPIIAGGLNACTLHYNQNNDPLPKNGLVLIDAGAQVNGYAADITRTYAVGTPTKRQKAVHAAVEKAHYEIIALIKPGVTFKDYQDKVDGIMKQALSSLGLLQSLGDEKTYRKYFPHAISHGLGIDVHESFGGYKEFMSGMILTVEPGIYIPEESIGVRIEDDILVTETGHKNLSGDLPTAL